MLTCVNCRAEFEPYPTINGQKLDLHARKRCLDCLPLRRLKSPRRKVVRPYGTKICAACGNPFPTRAVIDGKVRVLNSRKFCLGCSPFGIHNRSLTPPGDIGPQALAELRRKRRNAKTYRYQKKKRRSNKLRLIEQFGGACIACGYSATPATLEFHHRDAATKDFSIGGFSGSWDRLVAEAQKCDLLCANCHRRRHLEEKPPLRNQATARERLERKSRAVAVKGSACGACGRSAPPVLFEFHHRNASEKAFGISEDGIMRSWAKVVAELAKCVMLCANCHREVHAGVRTLDGQSQLAEEALEYAA